MCYLVSASALALNTFHLLMNRDNKVAYLLFLLILRCKRMRRSKVDWDVESVRYRISARKGIMELAKHAKVYKNVAAAAWKIIVTPANIKLTNSAWSNRYRFLKNPRFAQALVRAAF